MSLLEKIEEMHKPEGGPKQRKQLIDEYEAQVRERTYVAVLAS